MNIISVPKNAEAQVKLSYDEATPEDLVEWRFDRDTFILLWKANVFYSINKLIGSNIDDFEYEEIADHDKLIMIIESDIFDRKRYSRKIRPSIDQLKNLFMAALNYKTGVYFFF